MTGIEMARAIRSQDKFTKTPLIALTTRFSKRDVEKGQEAGFNFYLEKLNGEKLISTIDNTLGIEGEAV